MSPQTQTAKIRTITSLDELSGYEKQAKARGLHPDEVRALADMRRKLSA